jgi:hypothetical protein
LTIWLAEYSPKGRGVFTVTLAIGLVVVAAVSLTPMYAGRIVLPRRSPELGAAFVTASVALAAPSVLWHASAFASRNATFLAAFAFLLLGALLLMRSDGDEPGGAEPDDPPWWPSFERELLEYTRRRRPPVGAAPRR